MSQEINEKLKQSFKGCDRSLEIVDGEKLIVHQKKKNNESQHIISLLALSSEGRKIFKASWIYLIMCIILITFGAASSIIVDIDLGNSVLLKMAIIICPAVLAGLCFYLFLKSISRKFVLYSRHSNIPIVEMLVAKPDKEKFEHFTQEVHRCISHVQSMRQLSTNNQLAGEMRMIRRLVSEGLVKKEQYDKAKTQLLGLFGDQSQPNFVD
jgi:hypothetical protein